MHFRRVTPRRAAYTSMYEFGGKSVLRTIDDEVEAVGRLDVVSRILDVVCLSTGMRFAAVARVTSDRWIACVVRDEIAFGVAPGGELQISTTLCNEVRRHDETIIIDHVAEDAVYRGHPTPAMYGFQSYISVPIRHRGAFFGTLCAIDPEPARLDTPQTRAMFELFADLIARHMDAEDQLEQSRAALLDAKAAAELREQFIAVLGHDLRNPLAAVDAAARLLRKRPLDPHAKTLLDHLQASVDRMAGLIDNVLDFARGRLGGGFVVDRSVSPALESALLQVVDELRSWPTSG
jgi:GAF domain-containing protein